MRRISGTRLWYKFTRAIRLNHLSAPVRKVVIGLMGGTVLLIGVVMVILPGPAVLIIPLGLAILATEFLWAKRWMHRAKDWFRRARATVRRKNAHARD